MVNPFFRQAAWAASLACALVSGAQAQAHSSSHAHVHGQIQLGVAVDGAQVSVDIDSPLESLLGFERAARSAAEKKLAADWAARLREASVMRFNPEARCKLVSTDLAAPALGLGAQASEAAAQAHGHHADLVGAWAFTCEAPQALRWLDLAFFQLSPHARVINLQWVSGSKQGKQTLKRPQSRLALPMP